MKLIELSSNFPDFKTVPFKETGLSFIAGMEKQKSETSTYNGVGKTLVITLVDFCLGAKAIKDLNKMNCDIFLVIEIFNKRHKISRNTANPENVYLDGIEYSLEKFKLKLEELLKIEKQNGVRLRTLLPYFIRYKKGAFLDALSAYKNTKSPKIEYQNLLNIFYFFNLDLELIKMKKMNNTKLKSARKAKTSLEDNEIKQLITSSNTNIEIEYKITMQKISEKEALRNLYKVSDNYSDLKTEMNLKREQLNEISNNLLLLENNLEKIEKSLNEKHDITLNEIKDFYGELINTLSEDSLRELQKVEDFYSNMLKNRMDRLKKNKIQYNSEVIAEKKRKETLSLELDNLYKIIGDQNELIEYDALNREIEQLKQKISKYQNYKENVASIKKQILDSKEAIASNNSLAEQYLAETKDTIDELNNTFASLVVDLYGSDFSGSIDIVNNTNENDIQFEIEAKMKNDSSTGIGNSKILCFSTMLLILNRMDISFLLFDNKVFDGMASNQMANYFKALNTDNFQYIFTINQNQLNELYKKLGKDDYEKIILFLI